METLIMWIFAVLTLVVYLYGVGYVYGELMSRITYKEFIGLLPIMFICWLPIIIGSGIKEGLGKKVSIGYLDDVWVFAIYAPVFLFARGLTASTKWLLTHIPYNPVFLLALPFRVGQKHVERKSNANIRAS